MFLLGFLYAQCNPVMSILVEMDRERCVRHILSSTFCSSENECSKGKLMKIEFVLGFPFLAASPLGVKKTLAVKNGPCTFLVSGKDFFLQN